MRTIRYTFRAPMAFVDNPLAGLLGGGGGPSMEISTEVMLGNDDEAEAEGRAVAAVVSDFIDGLAEGHEEQARSNG